MKTFLYTALVAVLCVSAVGVYGFERSSSPHSSSIPEVRSGDNYYAIFMAHQSSDNTIAMSHTFALFLRTRGEGPERRIVESKVINWLPASGQISVVRPAELGVNKSIADTISWAKERNLEISVIGPFEIDAEFYRQAATQAERLERGEFKYRCYDARFRSTAKNCVHAVADMFDDEPKLETGTSRGLEATLKVVEHFRPRFKSAELTGTEWSPLLAAADLDKLPQRNIEMTAAAE